MTGGGGELINHEDGLILDGVALYSSVNVVNHGMIYNGLSQFGVQFLGSNAGNVTNSGEIYGSNAGVLVNTSITVGASISNSGEIRGDNHGIWLANSLGGAPAIVNSGTIIGRTNAIFATSGDRLNVINSGSLNGNVTANTPTRGPVTGQGDIRQCISRHRQRRDAGLGGISYRLRRGRRDSLSGGNTIDRLNGGIGNDTLTGNGGGDVLDGGNTTTGCLAGSARTISPAEGTTISSSSIPRSTPRPTATP